MIHRLLLATFVCILIVSCSANDQHEFETIVSRVGEYFSQEPILLTSNRITKEGREIYGYYAMKIFKHTLSYDIQESVSADTLYTAFIRIQCTVLDNREHGDLVLDTSQFQIGINSAKTSGFSTTDMALVNVNFSSESKCIITIHYDYRDGIWVYQGIDVDSPSKSLKLDLEIMPQNKKFREAVGMSS